MRTICEEFTPTQMPGVLGVDWRDGNHLVVAWELPSCKYWIVRSFTDGKPNEEAILCLTMYEAREKSVALAECLASTES